MSEFINSIKKSNNLQNIYDISWKLHLGETIKKIHYDKLKIGFINIPCNGYGDVIQCKKVYDYFNRWYPEASVKICSTSKKKFRDLGIKDHIIEIKNVYSDDNLDGECEKFSDLILNYKTKFDLLLVIPIINVKFNLTDFKKLIPYANKWNTYVMSEYNDVYGPYDFPVGIGKGQLGLFFEYNFKFIKQKTIKNPYALVYIQPSPAWGVHSKYCFLSYLEMICKKYSKKHTIFELIIPNWIEAELIYNNPFKSKCLKIIIKYFNTCTLKLKENEDIILFNKNNNNKLIIRGDILPQPRENFIGFISGSVEDILLTGNESLVDTLTCCPDKTIWYQIAPWKENLAKNLVLETGNKNYSTFKTSCGILKGFNFKNDVDSLIKNNDFRIKGKERFDSLLIFMYHKRFNKEYKKIIDIIDGSRFLDTLKRKIKNI